jgi:predicted GIY-YIG superfamily endonuclease
MRTRLERDPQQMAHCIYSICCECGRSYIGETGRPLAVRLHEHRHNLKESFSRKIKISQQAYAEGHKVCWDEATILENESNSRHRK